MALSMRVTSIVEEKTTGDERFNERITSQGVP